MNTPMNILCIDDYQDIRDMLAFVLRGDGHDVTVGCSVEEGRRLIDAHGFDLYIIDGLLGDGLGLDLCRYIRHTGNVGPIIFYSGLGTVADIECAKAAGADIYLTKPIHLQALLKIVSKCCESVLPE